MQSFVRIVSAENYESFVADAPTKNKILLFSESKSVKPLFKSLSKTFKDKLSFGIVRKIDDAASPDGLFAKFNIQKTPTLMALTEPTTYVGEVYDTAEMKIDQLKKWLSNYAYQTVKVEKKLEMHKLTEKKTKTGVSMGVCHHKSSNLCLILFLNGKGDALLDMYKPLLEKFKNDPLSLTYVQTSEETSLAQQFNIDKSYGVGAVIYKPKKGKFVQLSKELIQENDGGNPPIVAAGLVQSFIENTLGGSGKW